MLAVLQLIGAFVADLFKSRRRLEKRTCRFRKLRQRIRTRSPHDGNLPPVRPHAVRLLQAAQQLEAEILVLRHQLSVLQQRAPRRRAHLRWADTTNAERRCGVYFVP